RAGPPAGGGRRPPGPGADERGPHDRRPSPALRRPPGLRTPGPLPLGVPPPHLTGSGLRPAPHPEDRMQPRLLDLLRCADCRRNALEPVAYRAAADGAIEEG